MELKENSLKMSLPINLLLVITESSLIFLKRDFLPKKVPLFYSRPWGEDQLATKDSLFILPLLSLVLLVIAWQSARLLKTKEFMAYLINGFAILFSFLATITLIKIIFLIS